MKPKIVIIPGNGGCDMDRDNWYPWLTQELKARGYRVTARNMPDAVDAHMHIWLPFIEKELVKDENTIIIGHSSGGVAALRYLENNKLLGAVIVGVNYTDLGYPEEKEAGWYESPWRWDRIKMNSSWIAQFASPNDPFIPMREVEHIHQKLNTNLHIIPDRGHFMTEHNPLNSKFPEIVYLIENI